VGFLTKLILIFIVWSIVHAIRSWWARRGQGGSPAAPSIAGPGQASQAGASRPGAPGAGPSGAASATPAQAAGAALDAGLFAPVSAEAARAQARTIGWGWLRGLLDRSDRIPPASDARTQLIDRTMVAHGLLTPEALVLIHAAGEAMDAARPRLDTAHLRAEQSIAVDEAQEEAERAARKAAKKAEAAERKRRRDDEIARRKETDIVFLGRGVSHGLADRRADVERLERAGLPVLASPADVAKALGLSIPRLRWLAFHADAAKVTHYVRFEAPKKGGGVRSLAAPHADLKRAQRWIAREVLAKMRLRDAAHGFVAGRSTLTNARPHLGKAVVVNADLKDFFPTIEFPRARGIFQEAGYSPAASTILALLSTEAPRREAALDGETFQVAVGARALPQGAPTSPALSNLAARGIDARLGALAAKLGWTYTRYADDITLSADAEGAQMTGYLLARLRHIADDEGFQVNEKKTRVQRRSTRQTVTGVVVNERPGAPRHEVRRLRAILHRARKEGLAAQNREKDPLYEARLRGRIAYVAMLNPRQGEALRAALEAVAG